MNKMNRNILIIAIGAVVLLGIYSYTLSWEGPVKWFVDSRDAETTFDGTIPSHPESAIAQGFTFPDEGLELDRIVITGINQPTGADDRDFLLGVSNTLTLDPEAWLRDTGGFFAYIIQLPKDFEDDDTTLFCEVNWNLEAYQNQNLYVMFETYGITEWDQGNDWELALCDKSLNPGTYYQKVYPTLDWAPINHDIKSGLRAELEYPDPIADLKFSPSNPKAGQKMTFDASDSYVWRDDGRYWFDMDGKSPWYEVDNGGNPIYEHTYTESGYYTVKLKVEDTSGQYDIDSVSFTVSQADVLPTACFTISPSTPQINDNILFDADCSQLTSQYRWDFDGSWTQWYSSDTTTYTYTSTGDKTVKLEVKSSTGHTDTYSKTFAVGGSGPGTVDCHKCQGTQEVTQTFDGDECPDGWYVLVIPLDCSDSFELKIIVSDETNNYEPIEGATVTIEDLEGTTNEEGEKTFILNEEKQYDISVEAEGYKAFDGLYGVTKDTKQIYIDLETEGGFIPGIPGFEIPIVLLAIGIFLFWRRRK